MARSGSEKRKRRHQETFRTNDAEHAKLHANAAAAGLKPAAYCRAKCLDEKPLRAQRGATPNETLLAEMLHHLTAAVDHIRAGAAKAALRELMMIRHIIMKAAGAKP